MPDAFDPYNEWLDIPPEDQPPHHYQLLGIDLFEDDGKKIAHAALSRTETLRTYQLGSHFEASQQLLNQVAQAKLCLLDAERKAAYDAALKQRLSLAEAPAPTATDPAEIQRPQPTAEEAAEPIRNLDSQPEAEQELGSGEEAEQEEPTFPSTLPDFDAEPRTVRRTTGRKRRGTKRAASRGRDGAKRKGRTRAGRGRAGREAEEQHSNGTAISPAVKIGLPVVAGVLFVLIITYLVMTHETPDSEARSLLARAEVKMQQGDLAEATRLARQAINIEGANNLNTAKKLLDAIEDQRDAAAKAEAKRKAKQIAERKAKEEAEQRAKFEAELKRQIDAKKKAILQRWSQIWNAPSDDNGPIDREWNHIVTTGVVMFHDNPSTWYVRDDAPEITSIRTQVEQEFASRKPASVNPVKIKLEAKRRAEKRAKEEAQRKATEEASKRKAERTIEVEYWPNGQKKKLSYFKNGKRDGLYTQWQKNGQKSWEGHWKNGKPDGLTTVWYANGLKRMEYHHKNRKKDGLHTDWHVNGQKSGEVHYKNDKKDGLQTYWDLNGNKTREVQYKNGEVVSRKWFERS